MPLVTWMSSTTKVPDWMVVPSVTEAIEVFVVTFGRMNTLPDCGMARVPMASTTGRSPGKLLYTGPTTGIGSTPGVSVVVTSGAAARMLAFIWANSEPPATNAAMYSPMEGSLNARFGSA